MIAKEQRKIIDKKLKVKYTDGTASDGSKKDIKDYCVEYLKEAEGSQDMSQDELDEESEDDISGNISDSELDEMKLMRDQKKFNLQNKVEERRKRLATSLDKKSDTKDSLLNRQTGVKEFTHTVKNLQQSLEN